jgi:ubiquinone/menaquinone biosynthesis C-methylase UbiE
VKHWENKWDDVNDYIKILEDTFPNFRHAITGRRVLDIGCYKGMESLAISLLGAKEVIGIDIRVDIDKAKQMKQKLCPDNAVEFFAMDAHKTSFPDSSFDAVVTCASLEHFNDPYQALNESKRLLKSGGKIYLTSGVWASPYGAHMHFFTKMPWVQFVFSEKTIMNVRRIYRNDGATSYSEVEGGLNKIGVSKFKKYIEELSLEREYLYLRPVKGLTFLTRIAPFNELFTNLFIAILRKCAPQSNVS